jgi:hypothetical protein
MYPAQGVYEHVELTGIVTDDDQIIAGGNSPMSTSPSGVTQRSKRYRVICA